MVSPCHTWAEPQHWASQARPKQAQPLLTATGANHSHAALRQGTATHSIPHNIDPTSVPTPTTADKVAVRGNRDISSQTHQPWAQPRNPSQCLAPSQYHTSTHDVCMLHTCACEHGVSQYHIQLVLCRGSPAEHSVRGAGLLATTSDTTSSKQGHFLDAAYHNSLLLGPGVCQGVPLDQAQ